MGNQPTDLCNAIRGWHFTASATEFRGGRKVPQDDRWLVFPGNIKLCARGLHYSTLAIDALRYAPGCHAHYVEVAGYDDRGEKGVAAARRILGRANAETLLRAFARECASDVLHLWKAPAVALDWLATGDASLRSAAHSAASSAAYSASSAAHSAAYSAAYSAASSAYSAASSADREKYNARLEAMLLESMGVAR